MPKEISKTEGLLKEVSGRTIDAIKERILTITKGKPSYNLLNLCREIDASVKDIEDAVEELEIEGYDIEIERESVIRTFVPPPGFEQHLFKRIKASDTLKVGVISDTHYGNVKYRQDVIDAAYDHFVAEKISNVYHCGNLIDGYHSRINHNELLPDCYDLEGQLAFAAQNHPKKKGITTFYIAAEDHEGWWHRRAGLNIGRLMQQYFHHTYDRKDLVCVGFGECDIELRTKAMKADVKGPIMRLLHPGGGTAYALSYKAQKISEALQGGEKPQIQLIGHYHKFDYNYYREIHNIMVGCLEDQSLFMRKHSIPAHVGYCILEIKIQPKDGILEAVKVQWIPWYDKTFYQKWTKRQDVELLD
jgi:predicted phosphodiesterase